MALLFNLNKNHYPTVDGEMNGTQYLPAKKFSHNKYYIDIDKQMYNSTQISEIICMLL